MSARELINRAVQRCNYRRDSTYATAVLEDLTAAGYSIVHKDEIHAPSVERCMAIVDTDGKISGADRDRISDALRELMKEVG